MSLDKATVRRIAFLARLDVPEADLEPLAGELSAIMGWIAQLQEVDTASVDPMTGGTDAALPWRSDEITDGGKADKVIANATEAQDGFFTVPKVVE
jgi:aspartyl-tRNA(Asn)/glutamyl-tRNA(Gln) amidotransferase subunit C